MTRGHVATAAAVLACTLSVAAAEASAALKPCKRVDDRGCGRLTVPLDRSGGVPGSIDLRVELQKAKRSTRPPLFLIAGGPGQSSTRAFDTSTVREWFGTEARSRDIVVVDLRGTGRSGALSCPALQRGSTSASDVAACAAKLGVRRDFYSSADMAEDIDAVRAALGASSIALYGVSYGTHVALTYARRHPGQVDRLVLDSVVGPRGVDSLERSSMTAIPRVAASFCGKRRCRFTRDPAGDMERLAERLDREPLAGSVADRRGRLRRAQIDGRGLIDLMVATDSNPFLPSEIPAAVHSALRGDPAPLLRARAHAAGSETPPPSPRDLSAATYAAALCSDTQLPWTASTPIDGRQGAAVALVSSLAPGELAPFGPTTALQSSVLETCRGWPSPVARGGGAPAVGQLPDVPVLLLAGGRDVRTPVEDARAVAAELANADVLVVGNAGHGVLGWDFDSCASRAVRRFLAGGEAGRCGSGMSFSSPYPPIPMDSSALRPAGGAKGRAGRTARAVQWTVVDSALSLFGELMRRLAADDFASAFGGRVQAGALRGGVYRLSRRGEGLVFERAIAVRGIRLDGVIGGARKGGVRVSGRSAAKGRLRLRGKVLVGALGGQRVRIPVGELGELFGARGASSTRLAKVARRVASLR